MADIPRRTFTAQALTSLLTYSLLETAWKCNLFADTVKPITGKWLAELDRLGRDVKGQTIPQVQWQEKVEELFGQVEPAELMRLIDFDRLTRGLKFADRGARSIRFQFPQVEGLPTDLIFGQQIFALQKGRSVVPHGHNNMATAFVVLQGECRGRHYDRVEDGPDYFLIEPTIDRTFGPGDGSTISDYKDNVHWFQAVTEPAFLVNIHVLDVSCGSRLPTGRVYLNPHGEQLAGGLIKAPRIGYQQAQRMFG